MSLFTDDVKRLRDALADGSYEEWETAASPDRIERLLDKLDELRKGIGTLHKQRDSLKDQS